MKYLISILLTFQAFACDSLKPDCKETMIRIRPDLHDYECTVGAHMDVKDGFVNCRCPNKIDADAGIVTLTIDSGTTAAN